MIWVNANFENLGLEICPVELSPLNLNIEFENYRETQTDLNICSFLHLQNYIIPRVKYSIQYIIFQYYSTEMKLYFNIEKSQVFD